MEMKWSKARLKTEVWRLVDSTLLSAINLQIQKINGHKIFLWNHGQSCCQYLLIWSNEEKFMAVKHLPPPLSDLTWRIQ